MLKKIRIEVEAASPDECIVEMSKYEHALQVAEAERYGLGDSETTRFAYWGASVNQRSFYNEELGRRVIEEVIEYQDDASGPDAPVYKGRRVVCYSRIDMRSGLAASVPAPRVVDHWEDRTTYPDLDPTTHRATTPDTLDA